MNKHDISCNIIRMNNAKLKYDTATRSKIYILTSNIHIRLFDVQLLAILYWLIAYFIMTHCAWKPQEKLANLSVIIIFCEVCIF